MPHKHELKYLPLDAIAANDWNPQDQDEAVFSRLVDEITEVGFIDPLEVVPLSDGTYRILGGEHRWKAARAAGLHEVPCIVLTEAKWKDEDLQKFTTVRLNVLKGSLNPEKFLSLYNEMVGKYGKDAIQSMMGFTDAHAFQKILGGVKKGMKKVLPKEMQDEFDKQSAEAKTVADLSRILNALFAKYGDTVNQSFMVFTYGKQEHIYVAMDKPMRMAMDKVMSYCKTTGEDINLVMAPVANEFAKKLEDKLIAEMSKAAPAEQSTPPGKRAKKAARSSAESVDAAE